MVAIELYNHLETVFQIRLSTVPVESGIEIVKLAW